MTQEFTVEVAQADSDVRDMSQDIQESMDYGDPLSTWFNDEGQPHAWFVSAAAEEYSRRTGHRADGKVIAEAIYGLVTE
jgi:hypothetical protein